MRTAETGAGRIKTILSLAFLAFVIFVGIKVIPVYVSNYELADYIREQTPFWLTSRDSADSIQKHILDKAQDLGLPVTPDQVKVTAPGNFVNVAIDYTVPVNLVVYTLNLHFTPSAENKQL
jgi:hypothetical protein